MVIQLQTNHLIQITGQLVVVHLQNRRLPSNVFATFNPLIKHLVV